MTRAEREALIARIRTDAQCIADRFGLSYRAIVAERPNVKSRYGICYQDGLIKIRLAHATTGRPLRYSSLIDTLCHELAHLKHFDHGPKFQQFFWQLLGWARAHGIYQPAKRPRPGSAPRQQPEDPPAMPLALTLHNGVPVFSPEACLPTSAPATLSTPTPTAWPTPRRRPRPAPRGPAPRNHGPARDGGTSAPVQLRLF